VGKSEISLDLSKAGMNVLRFNFTGLWGNKGKFTMSNALKDLTAAMDFLNTKENIKQLKIDSGKIILAGYSFGTAVALIAALYDDRIENIFCIAVCDYSYFGRQFTDPHSKIKKFLEDAIEGVFSDKTFLNQDRYLFLKKLSENTKKYDIVRHAEKLLFKKILMVCGIDDNICPVEDHLFPVYRRLRELEHKNLKLEINKCGHEPPPDLQKIIIKWIKENV
jgi:predicted esterase